MKNKSQQTRLALYTPAFSKEDRRTIAEIKGYDPFSPAAQDANPPNDQQQPNADEQNRNQSPPPNQEETDESDGQTWFNDSEDIN